MTDKTMDENVINFPTRSRRSQGESADVQKAALSKEQFERVDVDARRKVDGIIKKYPLIKEESNRIKIATNLWWILEELERDSPNISRREVLYAAGQGSGTDSTKRLPYFAINPGLSDQAIKKRSKRLTKHISKYLAIVDAASDLVNKDKWVLRQRLIEGTSYSPSHPSHIVPDAPSEDLEIEGWDDIATAIQDIAQKVSNKHHLPRFFERVRALGIEYNGGLRQRVHYSTKQCDLQNTPMPALIRDEDLPPGPIVYLGEIRVCDDIPCTMRLKPGYSGGEKERELKSSVEAVVRDVSVKGAATPVLHAHIGLLPLGRRNVVAPALLLRPETYVRSAEEFAEFVSLGGTKWNMGDILGTIQGPIELGQNVVDTNFFCDILAASDKESFVYCDIDAEFEPDDLSPQYNGSPHFRSAIGHAWVGRFDDDDWAKAVLSRKPFTDRVEDLFARYCCETADTMEEIGIEDASGQAFTLSRGDTMAALLERSIIDAPEAARLDTLLDKRAGTLVRELESKIEEARIRHSKRLGELRGD